MPRKGLVAQQGREAWRVLVQIDSQTLSLPTPQVAASVGHVVGHAQRSAQLYRGRAGSVRRLRRSDDRVRRLRLAAEVAPLQTAWLRETAARARHGGGSAELEQFGWLLEELRVSLFAQQLKTPVPVSAKRLTKLWQSMRK